MICTLGWQGKIRTACNNVFYSALVEIPQRICGMVFTSHLPTNIFSAYVEMASCPVPLDADRDNTIKLGRISEHNVPTWFHHVKNMICISKFIFVLDIVNFRTKFEWDQTVKSKDWLKTTQTYKNIHVYKYKSEFKTTTFFKSIKW